MSRQIAPVIASPRFKADGAQHFPCALSRNDVAMLAGLDVTTAGRRMEALPPGRVLDQVARVAQACLGRPAWPVRAVLFDKTATDNWAVAWHQDRTIVVRARADVPGFGPWTLKQGLIHVAPPIAVLESMATLRIHIDDCDADNAPLQVALGSHRMGLVASSDAAARAAALPLLTCLAQPGDIWAYATPILHASARAARPRRRRVLQIDFATSPLPPPLEWLGLASQAGHA